jgi:hypothetical protein
LDTDVVDDGLPGLVIPEIDFPPAEDSTLFDPGDDFTDPLHNLPPIDLQDDPPESFPEDYPEVFDPPAGDGNIAALPEPGSLVAWSLLGLAGCGYAWRRKRRRQRV